MIHGIAWSDTHCGHGLGLTPPKYQYHPTYRDAQVLFWEWFEKKINEIQPDVSLFLGDAIDGDGTRQRGKREQFEPDYMEQAAIFVELNKYIPAKKKVMVRGTPYHTDGGSVHWEDEAAREIGAEIKPHPLVEVGGVMFSLRHKVGGSSTPYGKGTPLAKAGFWDVVWSNGKYEDRPGADVVLRGHTHSYNVYQNRLFTAISLPCLQLSSNFGETQCDGTIDHGFLEFWIDGGEFKWKPHLLSVAGQREIIKL